MKFYLYNAPEDYMKLDNELIKVLIQNVSRYVSLQKFSEKNGIKIYKLLKFSCKKNRRRNILISELRRILDFLIEKENKNLYKFVENNVFSIGRFQTILKPIFPIDFATSYGASILADILTDGALCTKGDVMYSNRNVKEIINNIKVMNLIFCNKRIEKEELEDVLKESRIKCKVYSYIKSNNLVHYLKYPVSIGNYLKLLGIPSGRRVYTDPFIPTFVFSSSLEIQKRFLERVIINEGYVKPNIITIMHSKDCSVDNKPPKLLEGYRKLFNNIDIKAGRSHVNHIYYSKEGSKRLAWAIHITGRQNLDKIRDKLNLNDKQNSICKL